MSIFMIHHAKTHLPKLLQRVQAGEDVVIARGEDPVARIVPFEPARPRRPGALKGRIALTPAFFEPLPESEMAAWDGDASGSSSTPMP